MSRAVYYIPIFLTAMLGRALPQDLNALPGNSNKVSIGTGVGFYRYNSGLTADVITPYFFHDILAIQLSVGMQWLEMNVGENEPHRWRRYETLSLSFVAASGSLEHQRYRCYGKAGIDVILPNKYLASKSYAIGCHTLIGLEFFVFANSGFSISNYIESGFLFSDAQADRLQNKPAFFYGMQTRTGLRIYPF